MSTTLVVDRIEGTQAVLLPASGGPSLELPLDRLPPGVAEGDHLALVVQDKALPIGLPIRAVDGERVELALGDGALSVDAALLPPVAVGQTLLLVPRPAAADKARQRVADRLRRLADGGDDDLVL